MARMATRIRPIWPQWSPSMQTAVALHGRNPSRLPPLGCTIARCNRWLRRPVSPLPDCFFRDQVTYWTSRDAKYTGHPSYSIDGRPRDRSFSFPASRLAACVKRSRTRVSARWLIEQGALKLHREAAQKKNPRSTQPLRGRYSEGFALFISQWPFVGLLFKMTTSHPSCANIRMGHVYASGTSRIVACFFFHSFKGFFNIYLNLTFG